MRKTHIWQIPNLCIYYRKEHLFNNSLTRRTSVNIWTACLWGHILYVIINWDLLDLKIWLITFKARNRLFPENLQRLFRLRSNTRITEENWIEKSICLFYFKAYMEWNWNSLKIDFKCFQNNINVKMTVKDCSDLMAKFYYRVVKKKMVN